MSSEPRKRITIKQVAREAGVSTQTVSRVVNERPDVAPATRERVTTVIERLGYRPNIVARSLIHQRSYSLGVVTAGLRYVGPARTLNGIADKARDLDYTLVLRELPNTQTSDVFHVVEELLARQIDGIVWAVQEMGDNRESFVDLLPSLPVPIVFLTMGERQGWHIVAIDNYIGGRQATQHLIDQGHRNIGHISGPLLWWEARQRRKGWMEAMIEAGVRSDQLNCMEGDWTSASGMRLAEIMLDQSPELSAVFAANDQMALGLLQYAHRTGIRVPEDLAVVGFDGIRESAYFWPPLSTVIHDQYGLGCSVVQKVVDLVENARSGDSEIRPSCDTIRPKLVVRESSNYRPGT